MPVPTPHGGEPRPRLAAGLLAVLVLAFPARAQETAPVTFDPAEFRYSLLESVSGLTLWTAPPGHKVTPAETAPAAQRSGLGLAAARREFEPVQLVIGPGDVSVAVSVAPFPALGAGHRIELAAVGFVDGFAETLDPFLSGATVELAVDRTTPIWITVFVPLGAPAGPHETTLMLTPEDGESILVPLRLEVFDFELPASIHLESLVQVEISQPEEELKDVLFEHRLTPWTPSWPSGLGPAITWDSASNPSRCSAFYDESDELPPFSIGTLAPKYGLGTGWNGIGFPSLLAFFPPVMTSGSTARPPTLCEEALGTPAYDIEWSAYLAGLHGWLDSNGLGTRAFAWLMQEPFGPADFAVAAQLCRQARAAAPGLRIAITEEPKPEIAEPEGEPACGYDVWIASTLEYQPRYARTRQLLGEDLWFYGLPSDAPPLPALYQVDVPGSHQRILGWLAWAERARGWLYPDLGPSAPGVFHGRDPGMRAALLREGFEDYEYLRLANEQSLPAPGAAALPDATVASVVGDLADWESDPAALLALRHELGRFVAGSRDTLPVLVPEAEAAASAALLTVVALARSRRTKRT